MMNMQSDKSFFLKDYYRMTGKKFRKNISSVSVFLFHYFTEFRIRYAFYLRWLQKHSKRNLLYPLFYGLKIFLGRKHGIEIADSARIGPGLYIGHPYNITVAGGVVMGRNVNIHKGATVGAESRGKRLGVPRIGNDVYIGINATVVGNIEIGNDVLIAANAFVNLDVPDHSIVLGNPCIIKYSDNAVESYINKQI